jgi:hypothetical protein
MVRSEASGTPARTTIADWRTSASVRRRLSAFFILQVETLIRMANLPKEGLRDDEDRLLSRTLSPHLEPNREAKKAVSGMVTG